MKISKNSKPKKPRENEMNEFHGNNLKSFNSYGKNVQQKKIP